MRVKLAYGREGLWVDLPDHNVTVVEPRFVAGVPDEEAAIVQALRQPIDSPPLCELVTRHDTVAIVFSDITRPTPNDRLLPPLLAELSRVPVPRECITLINGTGMHRVSSEEELCGMLGDAVAGSYRIVQHDAADPDGLVNLGRTRFGHEILVNRVYAEATVKILTGFIEPHLFAGFSGGPKAVLPGVAGARLVLENHGTVMLDDPGATWGVTDGNPVWEEMLEVALKTAPTFLLNVTLNRERAITGVYAGDLQSAHRAGAEAVRQTAMVAVDTPFDIVITSNSGYPLDLNLYQAVKGMSAAAQVVREGGSIIIAAECWDGIPDHGEYKNILHRAGSLQGLLGLLRQPDFLMIDQWEAQLQAQIQRRADVYVKSRYLSDDEIRKALFLPCRRIEETLGRLLDRYGPDARVCVLPDGPQTIPYVGGSA
jgi:nickel-dependent lactate racemase